MRKKFAGLAPARAAVLIVIVLVLGYELVTLIAQIGAPLPDFAANYVASRVALHLPGAPIYQYGALLSLNAAHQYVIGGFYPFTAPPFTLLALAPLALLPYAVAKVIWLVIARLCVLATALLLADAFTVSVERQPVSESATGWRWRSILRDTALRVGPRRFPAAPFALCATLLALTLPPLDAAYWDSVSIVALMLLALALDAYVRQHPLVAGGAVALAGGFSFIALVVLACFLVRGAWKAAGATLLFASAVMALPLVFFPARDYADLLVALRFDQTVYMASQHNSAIIGATANAIEVLGHMGSQTYMQAVRLGSLLALALAVLTVGALMLVPALRAWLAHTGDLPSDSEVTWPCIALALSATVLALPLTWPGDIAFSLLALLLVGAYPFLRQPRGTTVERIGDGIVLLALALALILQVSALFSGLDMTDLPLRHPLLILYLARPAAGLIVWLLAVWVLLRPYPRLLWRRRTQKPAVLTPELRPA